MGTGRFGIERASFEVGEAAMLGEGSGGRLSPGKVGEDEVMGRAGRDEGETAFRAWWRQGRMLWRGLTGLRDPEEWCEVCGRVIDCRAPRGGMEGSRGCRLADGPGLVRR